MNNISNKNTNWIIPGSTYKDEKAAYEQRTSEATPIMKPTLPSIVVPDTGLARINAIEEVQVHEGKEDEWNSL